MSIKTTNKRISLVAALALGFGVVTGVAANAAQVTQTASITSVTDGTTSNGVSVVYNAGVAITATVNVATATTMSASGDYIGATVAVTGPSLALPASTSTAVTSTVTPAATTATLTSTSPSAGNLVGTWVSTSITTAQALGTVSFTPTRAGSYTITVTPIESKIAGVVSSSSVNVPATVIISVGGDAVLAPTVGTAITANNAAVGQSAGITTYRYQPASFTKTAAAVTTYFATVDAGTIDSVTNGANSGTAGGIQALTNSFTNGTNNAGGFKLVSTIGTNAATWNTAGTQGVAPGYWDIALNSGAATSQTLTIKSYNPTTGAISVVATATSTYGAAPVVSPQYSLLTSNAGALIVATGAAADTKVTVVPTTAGTKQFTIEAVLNDQNNLAINGLTLGASIAGPGTIGIGTTTASSATSAGRSLTVALTGTNLGHVTVFGDGTAGTSTVTITATTAAGVTTILGTKAYTFVGSPAKATVAQNLYIAKAATQLGATPTTTAGAATSVVTTPAFTAKVVDSNGYAVVAGSTVKMTSSNTAVITAGTCAELTVAGSFTGTATPAPGSFECSVSGATGAISGSSATITFSVLNATTGLYDILGAPLTFKVGGAIATTTVTLDKSTYAPGSAMNLTAKAIDSTGFAAYDGQKTFITAALAPNMTVGGTIPNYSTAETVNGVYSSTGTSASLFAPASTGDLTISGTAANTATAGVPFTVAAKIVIGSTATDAAIASLVTKINALAVLIAKIQKKLGIK
jgi:hypothetical protein